MQRAEREVTTATLALKQAQESQSAALHGRFADLPEAERIAAMHAQEELKILQNQLASLCARESGDLSPGLRAPFSLCTDSVPHAPQRELQRHSNMHAHVWVHICM